jgi:hypothetical protein
MFSLVVQLVLIPLGSHPTIQLGVPCRVEHCSAVILRFGKLAQTDFPGGAEARFHSKPIFPILDRKGGSCAISFLLAATCIASFEF